MSVCIVADWLHDYTGPSSVAHWSSKRSYSDSSPKYKTADLIRRLPLRNLISCLKFSRIVVTSLKTSRSIRRLFPEVFHNCDLRVNMQSREGGSPRLEMLLEGKPLEVTLRVI